jgi:hypothetical protein
MKKPYNATARAAKATAPAATPLMRQIQREGLGLVESVTVCGSEALLNIGNSRCESNGAVYLTIHYYTANINSCIDFAATTSWQMSSSRLLE